MFDQDLQDKREGLPAPANSPTKVKSTAKSLLDVSSDQSPIKKFAKNLSKQFSDESDNIPTNIDENINNKTDNIDVIKQINEDTGEFFLYNNKNDIDDIDQKIRRNSSKRKSTSSINSNSQELSTNVNENKNVNKNKNNNNNNNNNVKSYLQSNPKQIGGVIILIIIIITASIVGYIFIDNNNNNNPNNIFGSSNDVGLANLNNKNLHDDDKQAWKLFYDATKGDFWDSVQNKKNDDCPNGSSWKNNPCGCQFSKNNLDSNAKIICVSDGNKKRIQEIHIHNNFAIGAVPSNLFDTNFPNLEVLSLTSTDRGDLQGDGSWVSTNTGKKCGQIDRCTRAADEPGYIDCSFTFSLCENTDLGIWQALYDSTNGNHWKSCSDNRDQPCNCLENINQRTVCDLNEISFLPKSIAEISLKNNDLNGIIPSSKLNQLSADYIKIDLSNNNNLNGNDYPPFNCVDIPKCENQWNCKFPNGVNLCSQSDIASWLELYDNLNGENWNVCSENRETPCDCNRVTCSQGKIIEIDLSAIDNLMGDFPSSKGIKYLSNLQDFDISNNDDLSFNGIECINVPDHCIIDNSCNINLDNNQISYCSNTPTKTPTEKPLTNTDFTSGEDIDDNNLDNLVDNTENIIDLTIEGSYETDLLAWQEFYDQMHGDMWFKCADKRSNPCACEETEKEVVCSIVNDEVRITTINLANNNLNGYIHESLLQNFKALIGKLDLSNKANSNNPNNLMLEIDYDLNCLWLPECNDGSVSEGCHFKNTNIELCETIVCDTDGGYADQNTACVIPFTLEGKNNPQNYKCLEFDPLNPNLYEPYIGPTTPPRDPEDLNNMQLWCPIVENYSTGMGLHGNTVRKEWGYCKCEQIPRPNSAPTTQFPTVQGETPFPAVEPVPEPTAFPTNVPTTDGESTPQPILSSDTSFPTNNPQFNTPFPTTEVNTPFPTNDDSNTPFPTTPTTNVEYEYGYGYEGYKFTEFPTTGYPSSYPSPPTQYPSTNEYEIFQPTINTPEPTFDQSPFELYGGDLLGWQELYDNLNGDDWVGCASRQAPCSLGILGCNLESRKVQCSLVNGVLRLTHIVLRNNNLYGYIPSMVDSNFRYLTELRQLDLSNSVVTNINKNVLLEDETCIDIPQCNTFKLSCNFNNAGLPSSVVNNYCQTPAPTTAGDPELHQLDKQVWSLIYEQLSGFDWEKCSANNVYGETEEEIMNNPCDLQCFDYPDSNKGNPVLPYAKVICVLDGNNNLRLNEIYLRNNNLVGVVPIYAINQLRFLELLDLSNVNDENMNILALPNDLDCIDMPKCYNGRVDCNFDDTSLGDLISCDATFAPTKSNAPTKFIESPTVAPTSISPTQEPTRQQLFQPDLDVWQHLFDELDGENWLGCNSRSDPCYMQNDNDLYKCNLNGIREVNCGMSGGQLRLRQIILKDNRLNGEIPVDEIQSKLNKLLYLDLSNTKKDVVNANVFTNEGCLGLSRCNDITTSQIPNRMYCDFNNTDVSLCGRITQSPTSDFNRVNQIDLNAWQHFYDAMHEVDDQTNEVIQWNLCEDARSNPCFGCQPEVTSFESLITAGDDDTVNNLNVNDNGVVCERYNFTSLQEILNNDGAESELRIKKIVLRNNKVRGFFPSLSILSMTKLEVFDISNTNLGVDMNIIRNTACIRMNKCYTSLLCDVTKTGGEICPKIGTNHPVINPQESNIPTHAPHIQLIDKDLVAWQRIYDSLNGEQWVRCSNGRNQPCSSECSSVVACGLGPDDINNQQVVRILAINLRNNNLNGWVPDEDISHLTAMFALDMSSSVNSPFRNFFANPNCLKIDLCYNSDVTCVFAGSETSTGQPPELCPLGYTFSPTLAPTNPTFETFSPTMSPITSSPSASPIMNTTSPTMTPVEQPIVIVEDSFSPTYAPYKTFSPSESPTTSPPTFKNNLIKSDREAWAAIYTALGGEIDDSWVACQGPNMKDDPCNSAQLYGCNSNQYRVSCGLVNNYLRITEIKLQNNNLNGWFPDDAFSTLTELTLLDVSNGPNTNYSMNVLTNTICVGVQQCYTPNMACIFDNTGVDLCAFEPTMSPSPTIAPSIFVSYSPTMSPTSSPITSSPTVTHPTSSPYKYISEDDIVAWQAFYTSLNGPEWEFCNSTAMYLDPCNANNECIGKSDHNFNRVICEVIDDVLRITEIKLKDNNLNGWLVDGAIQQLTELELLDLSYNDLTNTICIDLPRCYTPDMACNFFNSGAELCTGTPTRMPTGLPSTLPTAMPTELPSSLPSAAPTTEPTMEPTTTAFPTNFPTRFPTLTPTEFPTQFPTNLPTDLPTDLPTNLPTNEPIVTETQNPTKQPTDPTMFPTNNPTDFPTDFPTGEPTMFPSNNPTDFPTNNPTDFPTMFPSDFPTNQPTETPIIINEATLEPTKNPDSGIPMSPIDRIAWQNFYSTLNGYNWEVCSGENYLYDICHSECLTANHRVVCEEFNGVLKITEIKLKNNNVKGWIQPEIINSFSELALLDLSNKQGNYNNMNEFYNQDCITISNCYSVYAACRFDNTDIEFCPYTLSPTVSTPSIIPTLSPDILITNKPSSKPTSRPIIISEDTFNPTATPSKEPTITTFNPSFTPSKEPTRINTFDPTSIPTKNPTTKTFQPTKTPEINTNNPSSTPIFIPNIYPDDLLAFQSFYDSLKGKDWTLCSDIRNNPCESDCFTTDQRIVCDEIDGYNRLVEIKLRNNNLQGWLPSDVINIMDKLSLLDVSNNEQVINIDKNNFINTHCITIKNCFTADMACIFDNTELELCPMTNSPTTSKPTTRAPTQITYTPTSTPTTKSPTTLKPTMNPTTKSPTKLIHPTSSPTVPTTVAPTLPVNSDDLIGFQVFFDSLNGNNWVDCNTEFLRNNPCYYSITENPDSMIDTNCHKSTERQVDCTLIDNEWRITEIKLRDNNIYGWLSTDILELFDELILLDLSSTSIDAPNKNILTNINCIDFDECYDIDRACIFTNTGTELCPEGPVIPTAQPTSFSPTLSPMSIVLTQDDQNAFEALYDSMNGINWVQCADAREDPCNKCNVNSNYYVKCIFVETTVIDGNEIILSSKEYNHGRLLNDDGTIYSQEDNNNEMKQGHLKITEIKLKNNNLNGFLPGLALNQLTELKLLDLSNLKKSKNNKNTFITFGGADCIIVPVCYLNEGIICDFDYTNIKLCAAPTASPTQRKPTYDLDLFDYQMFYNNFNGLNWRDCNDIESFDDPCNYCNRIECEYDMNGNLRITEINMQNNKVLGLNDFDFDNEFKNLQYLKVFDISNSKNGANPTKNKMEQSTLVDYTCIKYNKCHFDNLDCKFTRLLDVNTLCSLPINENEFEALSKFYTSFTGSNWVKCKNLISSDDPCNECNFGGKRITCIPNEIDNQLHISEIVLTSNKLNGDIYEFNIDESFSELSYLKVLNLANKKTDSNNIKNKLNINNNPAECLYIKKCIDGTYDTCNFAFTGISLCAEIIPTSSPSESGITIPTTSSPTTLSPSLSPSKNVIITGSDVPTKAPTDILENFDYEYFELFDEYEYYNNKKNDESYTQSPTKQKINTNSPTKKMINTNKPTNLPTKGTTITDEYLNFYENFPFYEYEYKNQIPTASPRFNNHGEYETEYEYFNHLNEYEYKRKTKNPNFNQPTFTPTTKSPTQNKDNLTLSPTVEKNDTNIEGEIILCNDECQFSGDFVCDDGGSGAVFSICDLGTDCSDCGVRILNGENTPSVAPTKSPSTESTNKPTSLPSNLPTSNSPTNTPSKSPTESFEKVLFFCTSNPLDGSIGEFACGSELNDQCDSNSEIITVGSYHDKLGVSNIARRLQVSNNAIIEGINGLTICNSINDYLSPSTTCVNSINNAGGSCQNNVFWTGLEEDGTVNNDNNCNGFTSIVSDDNTLIKSSVGSAISINSGQMKEATNVLHSCSLNRDYLCACRKKGSFITEYIPTNIPSSIPTISPTNLPSFNPSKQPTFSPSKQPSKSPTKQPSTIPTPLPTESPILGTKSPTKSISPTSIPSNSPSNSPLTTMPSNSPSTLPSKAPITSSPTTISPSKSPTIFDLNANLSPEELIAWQELYDRLDGDNWEPPCNGENPRDKPCTDCSNMVQCERDFDEITNEDEVRILIETAASSSSITIIDLEGTKFPDNVNINITELVNILNNFNNVSKLDLGELEVIESQTKECIDDLDDFCKDKECDASLIKLCLKTATPTVKKTPKPSLGIKLPTMVPTMAPTLSLKNNNDDNTAVIITVVCVLLFFLIASGVLYFLYCRKQPKPQIPRDAITSSQPQQQTLLKEIKPFDFSNDKERGGLNTVGSRFSASLTDSAKKLNNNDSLVNIKQQAMAVDNSTQHVNNLEELLQSLYLTHRLNDFNLRNITYEKLVTQTNDENQNMLSFLNMGERVKIMRVINLKRQQPQKASQTILSTWA